MKIGKRGRRRHDARGAWFSLACLLMVPHAFGGEGTRVAVIESWSTVFSGQPVTCHVSVDTPASARGRLVWRLSANGGTLKRGESDVIAAPEKPARVALSFDAPEFREGVTLRTELTASFVPEGAPGPAASVAKTFRIFAADPFPHRKQWLGELGVRLFDPEKKTAAVLKRAGIPFKRVAHADALANERGIVMVGEGVSFRDYRALPAQLMQAAASGAAVLCLAPAEGEFGWPGAEAKGGTKPPDAIEFRRADIIRELNKRLDWSSWPPDGVVAARGLKLAGRRGPVVGEVVDGSEGWPWVKFDYRDAGALVITGFPIVEKWQSGPSPRYLFARLLEVLADEVVVGPVLPLEGDVLDGDRENARCADGSADSSRSHYMAFTDTRLEIVILPGKGNP